jgi:hypothetical protein
MTVAHVNSCSLVTGCGIIYFGLQCYRCVRQLTKAKTGYIVLVTAAVFRLILCFVSLLKVSNAVSVLLLPAKESDR